MAVQTKKSPSGRGRGRKKQEEFITELDQYLFGQGTHYDIYKKLGAHPTEQQGKTERSTDGMNRVIR